MVDICRLADKNTLMIIFVFALLDDGNIDLWKRICVRVLNTHFLLYDPLVSLRNETLKYVIVASYLKRTDIY